MDTQAQLWSLMMPGPRHLEVRDLSCLPLWPQHQLWSWHTEGKQALDPRTTDPEASVFSSGKWAELSKLYSSHI